MKRPHLMIVMFVLLVCMCSTTARSAPKIITDPDQPIDFEVPSTTIVTGQKKPPQENQKSTEQSSQKKAEPCRVDEEGRTRYNGAPAVKGIEFCDGAHWVGLLKVAPTSSEQAYEKCAPAEESLVRYNKNSTTRSYEYCNGENWAPMARGHKLPKSVVIDKPFVEDAKTPGLLANGQFVKDDGYVGGYIICEGGINSLNIYFTIGTDKSTGAIRDKVVGASAHTVPNAAVNNAQTSFFSYVPRGIPWKLWAKENWGGGLINKAACSVKLTVFGS